MALKQNWNIGGYSIGWTFLRTFFDKLKFFKAFFDLSDRVMVSRAVGTAAIHLNEIKII